MSKKPQIFIGFTEVANFVTFYKKGFESLGYNTFTVIGARNKFYANATYDVVLSEIAGRNFVNKGIFGKIWKSLHARITGFIVFLIALWKCDIFYYNTGGNIFPFRLDYKLIRFFGKKLIVMFMGSEIRHWYLYKLDVQSMGFDEIFSSCILAYKNQNYGTFVEKKERVKSAERYANLILSQPGFAQLQTKPYMRVTVGLHLPDYIGKIHSRKKPLIVHAPSARGIKGTEYVLDAIEHLRNEGIEFEFRLIENLANEKLLMLLTEADIVIDQLNSDTFGILSTEAMATGNAVVTSYIADLVKMPQPCPVLNTNKLNVYEHVKRLILDIDYRVKLAYDGIQYVRKFHDIKLIIQRDLNCLLTSKEERSFDYYPTFDSNFPIPAEILHSEKTKK